MSEHSNPCQEQVILRHLQQGETITQAEAYHRFGCFRLGARIFRLKQQGHDITSRLVKVADKTYVAEYSLKQLANPM